MTQSDGEESDDYRPKKSKRRGRKRPMKRRSGKLSLSLSLFHQPLFSVT